MKQFLVVLLVSFCCFKTSAQNPNWSFNVSDYQFSMTLTTSLNINGTTLSSNNDKVAAFVNGEVRGIANVTYVGSLNKYVAYLSVYANTNGETIRFKIYNSTNDAVTDISKTILFKIDNQIGSVFQSLSLANPILSSEAEFSAFSFDGVQEKSITIATNSIDVLVPANTDVANLVSNFTSSNNSTVFVNKVAQISGVSAQNFTSPVIYQVLSEDESILKEYVVIVSKEVIVSDLTINLSTTANRIVAQNPVTIQLTTNEEVLQVIYEDFTLTNVAIQSIIKVDATNYTINLVALKPGDFSIEIKENTIETLKGIRNSASNKLLFTYDNSKPYLISILRKTPNSVFTNANNLEFTATFNKEVQNVTAASFQTVSNATIVIEKISDKVYILKVSNIENYNGTVSVSLTATNTITDFSGNALRTSIFKSY